MKKYMIVLLLLYGCNNEKVMEENNMKRNIFAMGTSITIDVYGKASPEILEEAEKRIYEIESLLSVTDSKSEIYRINHNSGKENAVSKETAHLISSALEISRETKGAFDPTIYPVLRAWGFTTESYQVPTEEELVSLMKNVGYDKVKLNDNTIFTLEGMQLDLGGIAKGYTGDIVSELLKKDGVSSAIINLGGNVQLIGAKPNGSPWRIGIKAPNKEGYIGVLELTNCAAVTSGGYERNFTGEDGKIYSHILDPATGKPVDSEMLSATVIGKEGRICDAFSTALFVMGTEKSISYWEKVKNFEMILLTDNQEIYITKNLKDIFTLDKNYREYLVKILE